MRYLSRRRQHAADGAGTPGLKKATSRRALAENQTRRTTRVSPWMSVIGAKSSSLQGAFCSFSRGQPAGLHCHRCHVTRRPHADRAPISAAWKISLGSCLPASSIRTKIRRRAAAANSRGLGFAARVVYPLGIAPHARRGSRSVFILFSSQSAFPPRAAPPNRASKLGLSPQRSWRN